MRMLVTGGAGFIGSAFIRYVLKQKGFNGQIINLDLLTYAGNLDNVKEVTDHPQYTFVHGDILDDGLLERLYQTYKFTVIAHFAAESHVDRSIESPHPFLETNVMGTFKLLELVRRHSTIHFHHISTDEVFGSIFGEEKCTEESPYQPKSPYAASKAASDHLVRSYQNTYGISATLSYSSNNFGPFQHREKLIPTMIHALLEEKPLPIYGNGKQIRDWLFVEDHVEAIWRILQEKKSGESYAIAGGNERRNIDVVHQLVSIFAEMTGENRERLITHVADRAGHDFRYALSSQKIEKALGWRPKANFAERLRETMLWYMQVGAIS